MKRKIIILVLLICVATTLIACRSSAVKSSEELPAIKESENISSTEAVEVSSHPEENDTPTKLTTIAANEISVPVQKSEAEAEVLVHDPKINDQVSSDASCVSEANGLKAEILSVERCKDYLGTDCVQVKYNFTNNSSATRDFQSSISTSAFQNGRELNKESPIYPDYSIAAAQAQPVASGDSLEVICYFPVQNYNDSLELRIGIFKGSPVVEVINENSCTVSIP